MAKRQTALSHVNAQSLSGVFDVDYFEDRKVDTMPERKLTAQEWEQQLRDEELEQKRGRKARAAEEVVETDEDVVKHSSRFGAFSGANAVESDVGEDKTTASSNFEIEVTEEQKQQMVAQGIDVTHLEAGKKVKVAKIKWS